MIPGRRYGVIYADPPWAFATRSDKGKGRSAETHYPCMSLEDIKALPVAEHALDDCALFLWVTDPLLREGLDTLRAWGFAYKTVAFTWAKTSPLRSHAPASNDNTWAFGMGYWTRANPETCLLGTRGRSVRGSRAVRQLVVSPRREHSRKPDEVRERIEALIPAGPYLEMFARTTVPGWDAWGDETRRFDQP